ncbi:hypothetical protein ACRAWC_18720 [Leifsonia sp. L25]|uniref:hypothetical protein n=1 Tax=Leifsonia sp. L25 TaxID=3423957 RepID=UPI003D688BDB
MAAAVALDSTAERAPTSFHRAIQPTAAERPLIHRFTSKEKRVSPSRVARPSVRRPFPIAASLVSAGLIVVNAIAGAPLVANAVPAPTVALSTTSVSPYGWVGLDSVSGFGPDDALTITVDGTDVTGQLSNTITDSNGSITTSLGSIQIPGTNGGSIGPHTLVVNDATAGLTASANVQVVPAPHPTPSTIQRTVSQMRAPGISVVFSGFAPGDSTTFTLNDQTRVGQCGTSTADASGNVTVTCEWNAAFSASFAAFGPGQYVINGEIRREPGTRTPQR